MPNIEVIGFHQDDASHLERQMARFFCDDDFFNELVITRIDAIVANWKADNPSPFVRVYDTDLERANKIARALSTVQLDVEVVHLAVFFPAATLQEPHPFNGLLWKNTAGAWPRAK